MLKQVFVAHFEPVVTHFGPWKIPKCLEKGPFRDLKWVKNAVFQRDPGPFQMLKQEFLAHFEPWWRVLAHGKSQNALPRGYFGGQNGSKMGQKWVKNTFFQK